MSEPTRISFLPTAGSPTPGNRWLVNAAALVIVVAGLKAAEELLVPLVFASFIALLSAPPVVWLEKRRFPPWAAVSLVSIGLLVLLGGLGSLLASSMNAFIAALPQYAKQLSNLLHHYAGSLAVFGINSPAFGLKQLADPDQVIDLATGIAGQVASMLSDTALILLTTVFILLEVASIPRKFRHALGDPNADLSRYGDLSREVKQYVVIKSYLSVAMAVLVGSFLWWMGIDFPLLWAVVAGLLNFIPNIGALLSAIPAVALALVQFGLGSAVGTALAYTFAHLTLGTILEPRLMGRNLGLSTLVVFLSLVFWGWLWGPLGMVLSVPLTMIVKIVLEGSTHLRPVAELMDQPLSYRGTAVREDSRPTWEQVLSGAAPDETLNSPPS